MARLSSSFAAGLSQFSLIKISQQLLATLLPFFESSSLQELFKMSNIPRKPKAFAFDGEYRTSVSSDAQKSSSTTGLVSFFDDEPVETTNRRTPTEWSAAPAPEEDLTEGMDDFRRNPQSSREESEDLRELIAAMPHNVAKRQQDSSN